MKPATTPLTELRINTYEDPFLQHQYVCLGHKIAIIRVSLNMSQQSHISKYVPTRASTPRWD